MNLIKSLIFSGIILASTVSSYYPVNVNGVDVEQFTITTDTEGAIFEIPSVGTGKVSCKLPPKETPRPIYTTSPSPEAEVSGSVFYSETQANPQNTSSTETQVEKVIAQKGNLGGSVSEIQQKLKELGYLNGSADGDFGGQTEAAVKSFQKANGLDETGIVFEKDYQALMAAKAPAANAVTRSSTTTNTQAQTAPRYTYVVNTSSGVFHYDYCSFLPKKNYGEITGTREELIAQGYHSCGHCNP